MDLIDFLPIKRYLNDVFSKNMVDAVVIKLLENFLKS